MRKTVALLMGLFGVLWYPQPDFFPLSAPIKPEQSYTTADSLLFLEKQNLASTGTNTMTRTLAVAKSFLGAPYVHGCLDCYIEEKLTVNLREMDCWTFVENSLAIALSENQGFELYKTHLQHLRYWGGQIDGYGSRIHYFTGWLLQAEKYGILQDITASLGGIAYNKKVGYISARPAKYPKINNSKVLHEVQNAEKRINAHKWHYIPKNRIAKIEHMIQEGDLVCLTSVKADLDIAHQGFAVKLNGRIHLMHASSLAGKVIIARQPLAEYVAAQRGQSGIMVIRLQ
jgi:Protein of unknown function (DUF1460)